MTLEVNLASTCPNVTLSLVSGAARVWSSPQRDAAGPLIGGTTTSKTWTIGQQPSTVYIEALAGSTTVGGLVFTLSGGDTQTSASATPIGVSILLNGQDVTSKKNSPIIGQMIDLDADIDGPAELIGNRTYQWTVPGNVLRDYKIAPDGSSAATVALADRHEADDENPVNGLKQSKLIYFWASTTAEPPNPDHRTLKLTVDNLDGRTFERETKFDVFAPTSTASVANPWGTAGFDVNHSRIGLYTNGAPPGIKFVVNVTVPPGAPEGQFYLVQTMTRAHTQVLNGGEIQHMPNLGQWGLDNFPYLNDSDTGQGTWATGGGPKVYPDTPSNPLTADIKQSSITDEFAMHLMFIPPFIAPSDARPVVLKSVIWRLHVTANKTAFWALDGTASQSKGEFLTTEVFPEWSLVFSNLDDWITDPG
jgi:hypothetical protein